MTETVLPDRVLFVDDERLMRVAFSNAAKALGIEAALAESGWQAIELAQQETFPVVVTDLNMPGIDGMALIERLSALHRTTAFVIVSADPELKPRQPERSDGAVAALLGKPLDINEFQATLARAFALHRRRRSRSGISNAPPGWSILVVEDSPGDADLLAAYLEGVPGVRLTHAKRLSEALELVHDQEFDSIVSDIRLPDAHGFDAVLRLQASAPNASLLAHSGLEDEALALQVLQMGAQDFLVKSKTNRDSFLRALRFARERKRSELRLRRLAHFDQLTGLANRSSFSDALAQAVARVQRQRGFLAVMMIDLDGFKAINDSAGHEAGDRVLQEVGVRMRCLFREYDVVARLGGDEFAVLLTEVESPAALSEIAGRLLHSLAAPIGEHHHRVTGSVGIATFPDAGRSPEHLVRSADAAMYHAKRAGKNQLVFYDGPPPESLTPPRAARS